MNTKLVLVISRPAGQPVYEMVIERTDGNERQCFDSIPTLDSYFAPIWPESVIESAKTVIEPLKTVCPTAGVRPFYYFWFEEMQEG